MKSILLSIGILMLSVAPTIADTFESWNIGLGNDDVVGIAMVSDTDGWAYLYSSNMYHWDGQQWTRYEGPLGSEGGKQYSPGLEYYDPTHIYNYRGYTDLYIYDGYSWNTFEPPPPCCTDLKVINPNSIWGCGNYSDTCYWNGTEWILYPDIPGFDVSSIYCIGFGSAEEGWAGGGVGQMAHFYDGAWHAYGPITSGWLQNADFANNTYGVMDGPHVSLHYYNSTWDAGGYLPNIFTDCYAINDEYFVEVDENTQTIFLFHYDTYFRGYYTAGPPLYCVFATSPHSIWAGGENGYVCHWVWDGDGVQPSSVGQIKAQYPPVSGTSSSITPPKTKNDWNRLCPQLEYEK